MAKCVHVSISTWTPTCWRSRAPKHLLYFYPMTPHSYSTHTHSWPNPILKSLILSIGCTHLVILSGALCCSLCDCYVVVIWTNVDICQVNLLEVQNKMKNVKNMIFTQVKIKGNNHVYILIMEGMYRKRYIIMLHWMLDTQCLIEGSKLILDLWKKILHTV